jgi:hypothetical protein
MKITFAIQNTSGQPAVLFNARTNFLQVNMGNLPQILISIKSVSADYTAKYGTLVNYQQFLADCFKYDLSIVKIAGKLTSLDPFNTEFLTSDAELEIEIPITHIDFPKNFPVSKKL